MNGLSAQCFFPFELYARIYIQVTTMCNLVLLPTYHIITDLESSRALLYSQISKCRELGGILERMVLVCQSSC